MGASGAPAIVNWEESIWRVSRRTEPVAFSRIEPYDFGRDAGNRFDVRGGGVLYAGDTLECCFVETLARMRPSSLVRSQIGHDPGYMNPGTVPSAWRNDRCIIEIKPRGGPVPFLDLDHPDTLTFLDKELRGELQLMGIEQLDRGSIYSARRTVTRLVSEWAYSETDPEGRAYVFGGIRYQSRLGKDWICWAIFEGLEIEVREPIAIEKGNPDLEKVAKRFGLTVM